MADREDWHGPIGTKQILSAVLILFALVGGVWGMTEYFTPREVTEFMIADVQQNQIQIQKQLQTTDKQQSIQNAKNWYDWYQSEVTRLIGECIRQPNDAVLRSQLEQMTRLRNDAKARWDRLMR